MRSLEEAYDSDAETTLICKVIQKHNEAFNGLLPNMLDWNPASMEEFYSPLLNGMGYEYDSEWFMRILM